MKIKDAFLGEKKMREIWHGNKLVWRKTQANFKATGTGKVYTTLQPYRVLIENTTGDGWPEMKRARYEGEIYEITSVKKSPYASAEYVVEFSREHYPPVSGEEIIEFTNK